MSDDIPMLQGWYDQLSPGVDKISGAIQSMINPNYQIQQKLKEHIAANPELLQKLSDQEALNPGSVTNVFGSQVKHILGRASSDAQNEKDLRDGRQLTDIQAAPDARSQGLGRNVTGKTTEDNATAKA